MSKLVQARQALDTFKANNPNYINDKRLQLIWQSLQITYEKALHGYSII